MVPPSGLTPGVSVLSFVHQEFSTTPLISPGTYEGTLLTHPASFSWNGRGGLSRRVGGP